MVNYNHSIIYKIVCKDINVKEFYVGSTTNFNRRKQDHKKTCNNSNSKDYNMNVYQAIRTNNGWDNWDMVLVEKYECNDKLELLKRERYWIETLGATLNTYIPIRSKEERKEIKKDYREQNKEKFKQYIKEYRETNKNKIKHYNEANKERTKEYNKEYMENNKDKIKKQKEIYGSHKVKCEICNKELRRDSLLKHNKRKHN